MRTLALVVTLCAGLVGCFGQEAPEPSERVQAVPTTEQAPVKGKKARGKGKGRKAPLGAAHAASPSAKPAVTIVINTHDWYFHDDSARTVSRCIDILEKHGVKGEFYFTSALFRTYQQHHPELLERLQSSGMTISYHIRAPHPVTWRGPTAKRLQAMPHDEALAQLSEYETYRLDLGSGKLDRSQDGGYKLVKDAIGYAPPVVGFNAKSDVLSALELEAVAAQGARMWVREHNNDTMEMSPQGVLSRPSEFSIGKIQGEHWTTYNKPLDAAELFAGARGYGVVLVHEHDFYAEQTGWGDIYYDQGKQNRPPFDLTVRAKDHIRYPDDHIAQTWSNWEGFVAYAAENMRVVTSRDIISEYDASH